MATIGASLSRIEPGRVDISVPFADHITQQHGYIHGGVVGAIADNAAGYAAYSLINSKDSVLTVEYKLTLLAPAKGERVEVRAEVMITRREVRAEVRAGAQSARARSVRGGARRAQAPRQCWTHPAASCSPGCALTGKPILRGVRP